MERDQTPALHSSALSIKPATSLGAAIRTGSLFPKTDPRTAAYIATRLVELMPHGKPQNPEVYIAGLTAIIAEYPPEVTHSLPDPTGDFVRKMRFLPTIAELSEELDRRMEPHRRAWRRTRDEKLLAYELAESRAEAPSPDSVARVQKIAEDALAGLSRAPTTSRFPPEAGDSMASGDAADASTPSG